LNYNLNFNIPRIMYIDSRCFSSFRRIYCQATLYYFFPWWLLFGSFCLLYKFTNYFHSVFTRTYLPITCNTLNNDANRFHADCFWD